MKGSIWQRLDNVARRLVPLGLTLVLILFSVVEDTVDFDILCAGQQTA